MRNLLAAACVLLLTACSTSTPEPTGTSQPSGEAPALRMLPVDRLQPWEQGRMASAVSPDSLFTPGVERFNEMGNVSDAGETSLVVAGSGELSTALYRVVLAGQQPGAVIVDANLTNVGETPAEYWVGLSDYSHDRWELRGPYRDAQVTLLLDEATDYLSPLGNLFVTIAAHNETQLTIVGLAVSPRDDMDTSAPPVPSGLTATPVQGGLELAWNDVLAADLAGYHIHWSYSPFTTSSDNGVTTLPAVENTTRAVLPSSQKRDVYVALSAVDVNGNVSAVSDVVRSQRLTPQGAAGPLEVLTDTASVPRGLPATLTASGAELYDFDLDGDGTYEVTDDATGSAAIDTSATGIIRPRVRAHSADGTAVAFGSVSLIVSGNQRPVASALVDPASGVVPLEVNFTGSGEDFDGSIGEYAWDFEGDGIYDELTQSPQDHPYNAVGLWNAKLRVTDDLGAWDVDTVSVLVTDPVIELELTVNAVPAYAEPGQQVRLIATPGNGTDYSWDLDNDGDFETSTGDSNEVVTTMVEPGDYRIKVAAELPRTAFGETVVRVKGWRGSLAHTPTPGQAEGVDGLALATIGGNPAVAYVEAGPLNWNLVYARALDPQGLSWGTPVVVNSADSGDIPGWYPTLVEVNGRPAIAAMVETGINHELRYWRASDSTGAAWGGSVLLLQTVITEASMWVLETNPPLPAIAWQDGFTGKLRYKRAADSDGATWNPATLNVDNSAGSGYEPRLRIAAGNPIIGYRISGPAVRVVRALDSLGDSWGAPVGVAGLSNAPSFEIVGGKPAMVFCNDKLRFAAAVDNEGQVWNEPVVLSNEITEANELIVVNGLPVVIAAQVDGRLGYCRGFDAAGQTWSNFGTAWGRWNSPNSLHAFAVAGSPAFALANAPSSTGHDVLFGLLY